MLRSTKMGVSFLFVLGLAAAIAVVGENDYQDQVMSTHVKCETYPQLTECIDYDDTAYRELIGKQR